MPKLQVGDIVMVVPMVPEKIDSFWSRSRWGAVGEIVRIGSKNKFPYSVRIGPAFMVFRYRRDECWSLGLSTRREL